jgi:hypothetical protein
MDSPITCGELTVILATVLPGWTLILLGIVFCWYCYRRKARFLRRGLTPIDDEEIESWKGSRNDEERPPERPPMNERKPSHYTTQSTASIPKPPSVIVYQNPPDRRMSEDQSICPSPSYRSSLDIPSTPILARAPNSRPGLTDESIQGDDAFLPQPKRPRSRLSKHPPVSLRQSYARSTRSLSRGAAHAQWYGYDLENETPPWHSTETFARSRSMCSLCQARRNSAYSCPANPPRASYDEEMYIGGLSPRPPVHKSEIGRAIG